MRRQRSEDLLIEAMIKPDKMEALEAAPNWPYMGNLLGAMREFSTTESQNLMRKFEILQCRKTKQASIITKQSMKDNFLKIFGYDCPYLAGVIYDILAGTYTLDKPLFLKSLHKMFSGDEKYLQRLSFRIYNEADDLWIKVNEVSNLLFSLQENTKIYEEVMTLTNQFMKPLIDGSEDFTRICFKEFA